MDLANINKDLFLISMKLSDNMKIGNILLCAVPMLLIVPNVYICLLEHSGLAYVLMSILLPLGMYFFIVSVFRNTPMTVLLMIPIMALSSFQIVVSSLYNDGSAIGIDMFLNVWTTNYQETKELLKSIAKPVIVVAVIYLPSIFFSCIALRRKDYSTDRIRKRIRVIGIVCLTLGSGIGLYSRHILPDHSSVSNLFPFNAVSNLSKAISRHQKTAHYLATSEGFSYNAHSLRTDARELYIVVIGETSRTDNWQLSGYSRATNPFLSCYGDSLIVFGKVFSESNTTHKSVPMLLTTLSSDNFDEGVYEHKSIITAFREAGFQTVFISAQKPNHSFIEEYAKEAHITKYFAGEGSQRCMDANLLPYVKSLVESNNHLKMLLVIHLYGSHYNYKDRYPAWQAVFKPDECGQAKFENRDNLINAYDNTIVYTDSILHELCELTEKSGTIGGLIYCSDHGEDLFDDYRCRFLHASPRPTYWQLHVPFLIFLNSEYNLAYPYVRKNAFHNRSQFISSSRSFSQTLLQIAGIDTDYSIYTQSVVNHEYRSPARLLFLNDRNEVVDLIQCGFDSIDRINYFNLRK